MVGASNGAKPCLDTRRAPEVHNSPALPKIFRAFVFADDRVEASANGGFQNSGLAALADAWSSRSALLIEVSTSGPRSNNPEMA